MCSGQHAVSLLLSRLKGWDLETYWRPEHPSQAAYRAAVARAYGTTPREAADRHRRLRRRDLRLPAPRGRPGLRVARRPVRSVGATTRAARWRRPLTLVRDAMLANPEMVGGRHDRLDTSLMKAAPDRLISKAGMEALRGDRDPARPPIGHPARRRLRAGHQDRGRRRLRPRDVGRVGRGAAPGRRARRPGASRARALPPADHPRPAWSGRGGVDPRVRARAGRRADRLTGAGEVTARSARPARSHHRTDARRRPVSHARSRARRVARRGEARLSPPGQGEPPGRRG